MPLIEVIAGGMAVRDAQTDLFAAPLGSGNDHPDHIFDRFVPFVGDTGDQAGVAIQAVGQLGQVVGADGKAIEVFEKLVGEYDVRRYLAHHDHAKAVDAAFQLVIFQQLMYPHDINIKFYAHQIHKGIVVLPRLACPNDIIKQ